VSARPGLRPRRPPAPPPAPPAARWSPAVVAGAVALALSALFAALSAPADPGSDTPEEAVLALLDAAAAKDVLGVTGALVPAERDPLRPSLVKLARELRRLELIAQEGSLARIGASVDVGDVALAATPLGPDSVAVRVTGGRVATRLDPAGRPLGDVVRGLAGLLGVPVPRPAGAPGDGATVVAVRQGGRWYVSFWASVAETSPA
jgi:hypothetical protein